MLCCELPVKVYEFPSKDHFPATKSVVIYLAGSKEYGLWFSRGDEWILVAYSNSDWGGCKSDRKSTTGMFLSLGSSPISWGSRKKEVVALSTTKVEYIIALQL